jgi:phage terminase large subunit GpA-like protein
LIARNETSETWDTLNDYLYRRNLQRLFESTLPNVLPAVRMPILDWCEENFRYPTGPKVGHPYSRKDQPATALFLQMLDSDYWRSAVLVAPNQVGKSLSLVQFVLHVNFNLREDVIFGLPDIDKMWSGKWLKDFVPAMNSSDLKKFLPKTGSGSSGGTPKLVLWDNGQTLTPMGAGGGDTQRAGATARVVVITEMKEFGVLSGGSEEGAKIDQLSNRTRAHMGRELVFGESTVTTPSNITWQWFKDGTQSMPHFPCESCEEYIAPEREHLIGWQNARTEEEARYNSMFSCPCCGVLISDAKRRQLLQECLVLHKGQTVDKGKVIGDVPPTRRLSYRFTASTNMFCDAGSIGVDEWRLFREQKVLEKLKKNRALSQGFFGFPVDDTDFEIDPLDGMALTRRQDSTSFGFVPPGTTHLFAGVDVRKTTLHWTVLSVGEYNGMRIVAWGQERVLQDIPLDAAILCAGKQLQNRFQNGFLNRETKEMIPVSLTLMDSGWKPVYVQAVCDNDDFWMPVKGFGEGVLIDEAYRPPNRKSSIIRFIGDGFDVKFMDGGWAVHCDASVGKSELHAGLRSDINHHSAILLPKASPGEIRELVMHLTAEIETVVQDGGESSTKWKKLRDDNHLLDSTSYARIAKNVWDYLQELLEPAETDDDGFRVYGDGPLFGAK